MIRQQADPALPVAALRPLLLGWWGQYGRHTIPWKRCADAAGELHDHSPSWVEKVVLKQIQLKVVLPYWQRWMQAFPTLEALAAAEERDVLML